MRLWGKLFIIFFIYLQCMILSSYADMDSSKQYFLSPATYFEAEKENVLTKIWVWIKAGLNIADRDLSKMEKVDFFEETPDKYKLLTDMKAEATKYSLLFVVGPYYKKNYSNVIAKRPNGNPNLPDYKWHLNVVSSLRELTPKAEIYPASYRVVDGKKKKIDFLLIQRKIIPLMDYISNLIQHDTPMPVLMRVIDNFMNLQKQLVLRKHTIDLDPKPLRNYGFNPIFRTVQIFDLSDLNYNVHKKYLPKEIETLIYSCKNFGKSGFKILKTKISEDKHAQVDDLHKYYTQMLDELHDYLLKTLAKRDKFHIVNWSA